MKQYLLALSLAAITCLAGTTAAAQLAPDQNPNFAVSRDKYMKVADSVNQWHSTTLQERYKAIDWLADRQEARAGRRDFRRQLRMERARWSNDWYSYNDSYYRPRGRYYQPYRNYYRGSRRAYSSWWGFNFLWP